MEKLGICTFINFFDSSFLYTILSDPVTSSVPVLILSNKQDETLAKGSTVVKSLLEKEMYISLFTHL